MAVKYLKENSLQKFANDYLKIKGIQFLHIDDGFFKWLNYCPSHIKIRFYKMFGGVPDCLCLIPAGNGIALSLLLELKTLKGQLHGVQKKNKDNWKVCKTPEEAKKTIDDFIELSEKILPLLKELSDNIGLMF